MRIAAIVALAGCASTSGESRGVEHLTGTVDLANGGVRGARIGGEFGFHGVELSLALDAQSQHRADDTSGHTGTGTDVGLRLSAAGLLDIDDRLAHWFDFGAEAIAGTGINEIDAYAQVAAGGWVELGLWSGTDYPALILDARRVIATDPWNNETVFGIGLAWTVRMAPRDEEP